MWRSFLRSVLGIFFYFSPRRRHRQRARGRGHGAVVGAKEAVLVFGHAPTRSLSQSVTRRRRRPNETSHERENTPINNLPPPYSRVLPARPCPPAPVLFPSSSSRKIPVAAARPRPKKPAAHIIEVNDDRSAFRGHAITPLSSADSLPVGS